MIDNVIVLRCEICQRKLAEAFGKYHIFIKCVRCKNLNSFK